LAGGVEAGGKLAGWCKFPAVVDEVETVEEWGKLAEVGIVGGSGGRLEKVEEWIKLGRR